jgi:hypothetical protein
MNPETKKTILYALLFGGLIAGGIVLYKKLAKKELSKSDKVIFILTNSGGVGDFGFLITLDDLYIDTWYAAVAGRKPDFKIGNQTFSSVTGKQIA